MRDERAEEIDHKPGVRPLAQERPPPLPDADNPEDLGPADDEQEICGILQLHKEVERALHLQDVRYRAGHDEHREQDGDDPVRDFPGSGCHGARERDG